MAIKHLCIGINGHGFWQQAAGVNKQLAASVEIYSSGWSVKIRAICGKKDLGKGL